MNKQGLLDYWIGGLMSELFNAPRSVSAQQSIHPFIHQSIS
jgi:hypothetical protein